MGALLACARACTVLSSDRLAGDGTSMWAKVLSAVWRGALIFDRIAYKLRFLFFKFSLQASCRNSVAADVARCGLADTVVEQANPASSGRHVRG